MDGEREFVVKFKLFFKTDLNTINVIFSINKIFLLVLLIFKCRFLKNNTRISNIIRFFIFISHLLLLFRTDPNSLAQKTIIAKAMIEMQIE